MMDLPFLCKKLATGWSGLKPASPAKGTSWLHQQAPPANFSSN